MNISFENTLKRTRESRKITIKETAGHLYISSKKYKMHETGEKFLTIFSLDKLAILFEVSPSYLLTGVHNYDDLSIAELPLTINDSFGIWFYKWIYNKRDEVTVNQICSCHSASQYILYEFKNSRLDEIFFENINLFLKKNCFLAQRTLRLIKSIIKQVFAFAIDCRAYNYNPAINVKIPKAAAQAVETMPISNQTKMMIMQYPHILQPAAVIMLLAGLRRGELLALTYGDIHLFDGYISVNKVVEMQNGVPVLKHRAKTECGVRNVSIPQALVSFFIKYLGIHTEIRKNDLIISNNSGKHLTSKQFNKLWKNYIVELNAHYGDFSDIPNKNYIKDISELPMRIETFTTKQLRHTYATMLYESEVDVLTAKEQMGHSRIQTTLDIYTHLDKTYKRNNLKKFDTYLNMFASNF